VGVFVVICGLFVVFWSVKAKRSADQANLEKAAAKRANKTSIAC